MTRETLNENEEQAGGCEASELTPLLAILAGQKKPTDQEKTELLRVATMCGVAGLYEHYKEDVIAKFTLEELQEIVGKTEPFRGFTVEHIYHTALYG